VSWVPVLDKTGLTGRYDFTFDYAGPLFAVPNTIGDVLSSIERGLDKQLGLKLIEGKVPQDILVIDHVEKMPAEN
jgi:uncharacterized protein (TIGR03435 family)